ncbi:MAG: NADH:flavin oxidoreductase, partial [Thermoleophilia bacterium]|nr:NADH:flavin oxidoreductase [Thermoleophilia bacterium]
MPETDERDPILFTPLQLRDVTLPNRIAMSPMCQYSSDDGFATDWHLAHVGARAVGGAGLVIMEASAVSAAGRITAHDLGIWKDEHVEGLARVAAFARAQGAVPGIQLAHAGRKASTARPWEGGGPIAVDAPGGWPVVGPSPLAFDEGAQVPHELTVDEIADVVANFAAAAVRAERAGFDVVELHAAHGYLLHEFLSPLANQRADGYGGDFEGRARLTLECIAAVREVWPAGKPLLLRVSATDWVEGGWDVDDTVRLAGLAQAAGVDLVDCSSGGASPLQQITVGPGYQAPFAAAVRAAGVPSGAVGLITEPEQAEALLDEGACDL